MRSEFDKSFNATVKEFMFSAAANLVSGSQLY